eukprot:g28078.t1
MTSKDSYLYELAGQQSQLQQRGGGVVMVGGLSGGGLGVPRMAPGGMGGGGMGGMGVPLSSGMFGGGQQGRPGMGGVPAGAMNLPQQYAGAGGAGGGGFGLPQSGGPSQNYSDSTGFGNSMGEQMPPRFDLSDFPALGDTTDSKNPSIAPQPPPQQPPPQQQEFRNEDFPALGAVSSSSNADFPSLGSQPGSTSSHSSSLSSSSAAPVSLAGANSQGVQRSSSQTSMAAAGRAGPAGAARVAQPTAAGRGQAYPVQRNSSSNSLAPGRTDGPVRGGQDGARPGPAGAAGARPRGPNGSGTRGEGGGAGGAATNKYGLLGLLNVTRMIEPDLNTLALGTDLTSLGLNLNSTDVLYANFAYPCMDHPTKREPEYVLPYCYYMNPPALKTSHFSKFQLETLFYIFYNMPKDTLQVYAAKELYNRSWLYHKDLKIWFLRPPVEKKDKSLDPSDKDGFVFFDVQSWERRLSREALPDGVMTEEELHAQTQFH